MYDDQLRVMSTTLDEFLPLLHIGQLTHAGKPTVFGLGRYRLREV